MFQLHLKPRDIAKAEARGTIMRGPLTVGDVVKDADLEPVEKLLFAVALAVCPASWFERVLNEAGSSKLQIPPNVPLNVAVAKKSINKS